MSDFTAIALRSAALAIGTLILMTSGFAWADQPARAFDIGPQSLETALTEFARQSGQALLFAPAVVAGKTTKGVHGRFGPLEALTALLKGTGLSFTTTQGGAILVGPPQASEGGFVDAERLARAQKSKISAAESAVLDEVVVTAQKRSEYLSSTPVAVTVLGSDLLDEQGVTDVSGLNGLIPNLSVGFGSGEPRPYFTIRGITSSNLTELGNPAIAFHVDNVYVARPVGMSEVLYDIDRIEILRGPQGTLYGKSATSGSVNVITTQPVLNEFQGKADISGGNYGAWSTGAVFNIPVSDTFALRVSTIKVGNDGYQGSEGTTKTRQQLTDQYGVRVGALWKPISSLTWYLDYNYFRDTGVPSYSAELTAQAGGRDPWNRPLSSSGFINEHQSSVRTHLDWSWNDALSVSYIGGYLYLDRSAKEVFDESSPIIGHWTFPNTGYGYNYSHEIDLHFGGSRRFHGLIGALIFHELSAGDTIINAPPTLTVHFDAPDVQQKSRAAFAQTTFDLTASIHLTAGLRDTRDDLSAVGFRTYSCPFGTPLSAAVTSCQTTDNSRAANWRKATWRVALDDQLTPSEFTYVSVSTGYKPGGFGDLGTPAYKPETVASFETGLKSRLLDNRMSLDNSLFYMDYRDLQVSTARLNSVTGELTLATDNAASASIYGFESEYDWRITSTNRLSGYIAALRARYDKYSGASDPFLSAVQTSVDLSGKRLIKTPSFSQQLTYEHTFTVRGGGTVAPSIGLYWQTAMYLRAYNESIDRQAAYSRTNLTLAYHAPKDQWSLAAFINNVEDRNVLQTVQTYAVGSLAGTYLPPRTYGLRFAIGF